MKVALLGASDQDDTATIECHGVEAERDKNTNISSVEVPVTGAELAVSCSLDSGESFVATVPGLLRDENGRLRHHP